MGGSTFWLQFIAAAFFLREAEVVGQNSLRMQCMINVIDKCAKHPRHAGLHDDSEDAYNSLAVGRIESNCLERARQYFEWCGNEVHQQVVASFVPTGTERVYPPDDVVERTLLGQARHDKPGQWSNVWSSTDRATLQALYYQRFDFGNGVDHFAAEMLSKTLKEEGLCSPRAVPDDLGFGELRMIIGGLNKGSLAARFLSDCPLLHVDGFEVQVEEVRAAHEKLSAFANARVHHLGLSDADDGEAGVAAMGACGGLFAVESVLESEGHTLVPFARRLAHRAEEDVGWQVQTVRTISLATWADRNAVEQVLYLSLDIEGHEALAIEGMRLDAYANRRRFSAFQFELGGTWAQRDPRRPSSAMNQIQVADFLQSRGYSLYMIGPGSYMLVQPHFFHEAAIYDEGFGPFVQGNLLAVHRETAHPAIVKLVDSHTVPARLVVDSWRERKTKQGKTAKKRGGQRR